ncbi:dipeptidyl aminopeptidase/acylaminoacyl peptidase [Salsuginibacillus halophilus]|uniref:Acyl-peptide hydrolase n=1 Tax=Salsuginibacillus halophilus TaxID=517424 RepID=A0A2P8H3T0_9BACI|nr:S9 family peptidase [Salsuginibacillus halophilus]PSL40850.1 dipeptidyl aminopeptidase/acylaminoacyl peptidase [Salsuginibacillus halophilus]
MEFPQPNVEQFFQTLVISDFAVAPDESQLLYSTNINGAFNLWAMDLPHTYPYPLTTVNQDSHGMQYAESGSFAVVGFDRDGDELSQLYALHPEGGPLVPLLEKEGERHMGAKLTKDSKWLYYSTTRENPTYLNIERLNLETYERELMLEGEEAAHQLTALSPEGTSFVFVKVYANTYILPFLCDSGEVVALTPETAEHHTVSGIVYTSERDVYMLTNYDADRSYLARMNLDERRFEVVTTAETGEFSNLTYSKKEHALYVTATAGVSDLLYRYDLTGGNLTAVEAPVENIVKLTAADSGTLYMLGRGATMPFNLFQKRLGETWEPLTNHKVPGVPRDIMSEPEVLNYRSFDDLEIEALFFPARKEAANGHTILWPHGGPQASERKMFRSLFQLLAYEGYNILAPNFRGSSDYGLSFKKMVEGDWGYGPRLDNIYALEYVIEHGYADREKLLLMGGSYGGYMALLLHGRHPEYFKAVVDIFGVSNLFSFVKSVPDFWKPIMQQWLGDPEDDYDRFVTDSPITYLDQMTKPMLVIQGANDPRVVQEESDQIVDALRENGVDVEYLVLEDEGHGFSKKENEIEVYQRVLEFFARYV